MQDPFPYFTRKIAHGLRTSLAMSNSGLPNYRTMDSWMWSSIKEALMMEDKVAEFEWLNFGPFLTKELRKAPRKVIRDLSETSICSFRVKIDEGDFVRHFGRHVTWKSLHKDMRINYYRARFASIYWCSVRDYAVSSIPDCVSVFRLPKSIVEVLSESSTSQIIDFCHGFSHLQTFDLTCPVEDCLRIIDLQKDQPENEKLLLLAKMLKSNHAASIRGEL